MITHDILYSPVVDTNLTVRGCLLHLETNHIRTGFVVSCDGKLLGVFTDGDIRRGFLRGVSLDDTYHSILNRSPRVALQSPPDNPIIDVSLFTPSIDRVPICDMGGKFLGLLVRDCKIAFGFKGGNVVDAKLGRRIIVLIQAGGFGRRMGNLTEKVPKPMLGVGGEPLMKRLVDRLAQVGLTEIVVSVHYLGDQIINYFGDGSAYGVNITYITEEKPLGTAGAFHFINKNKYDEILVINADISSDIDFEMMFDTHHNSGATITAAVNRYDQECPFGVVDFNQSSHIIGIREKPMTNHIILAGIYICSSELICSESMGCYSDMPDLIGEVIENGGLVAPHYLYEKWRDIGTPAQLKILKNESEG